MSQLRYTFNAIETEDERQALDLKTWGMFLGKIHFEKVPILFIKNYNEGLTTFHCDVVCILYILSMDTDEKKSRLWNAKTGVL